MNTVKRDFILKESRALIVYMLLFAALLTYIIFYTHMSPLFFLIIPVIIAVFALRLNGEVKNAAKDIFERYPESFKAQIEKEYGEKHPIFKVAYGEIHLLNTCVVCRNKRRLIFIPVKQVIKITEQTRLAGTKRIPLLKFELDGKKPVDIDFSFGHSKDGEAVLSWFAERIGEGKLERSGSVALR